MGEGADRHANPAVGADGIPVAEAGISVDAPAPGAIDLLSIVVRDRLTGAILSTFLAKGAKVEHETAVDSGVCDQRQIRCHYA